MRVETFGGATLYLGDCREIIPQLTYDAVVTDPPYGIEDLVGGYSRSGATILNDTNLDCCFQALMLLKGNLRAVVFYSCRITPEFFHRAAGFGVYAGELIWDKKAPGMGSPLRYQHENIAIFELGTPPQPIPLDTMSVIPIIRAADLHPHQKPVPLMEQLVTIAGGQTVLDCFMGSGSTGVAALKLGRKFIGIELDPKHYETACCRIEAASKQDTLW